MSGPVHPTPAKTPASSVGSVLGSLLALLVIAVFYDATFYNYGYEWGDLGSYAQICFELTQGGRPAGDFVGYGPLWYLLGKAVFVQFGVNYKALLVMLYVLQALAAVLLFLAVRAATDRVWPAVLVALVFILVPPFTASTIRALCLALNALPLVLLARAPSGRGLWRLLLAGAAVGLTFLLRADFAYLFLAALLLVITVRAWSGTGTLLGRLGWLAASILVALTGLAAAMAPVLRLAAGQGWLAPVLDDFFSYPRRFWHFFTTSTSFADMTGNGSGGHDGGFLRILPLSAILGPDPGNQIFAILIYSTMLGLALFGGWLLVRRKSWSADATGNTLGLAVLLLAASQWPIFVLFRPSWVHFLSFMHGYLLLAAFVAVRLVAVLEAGGRQPVKAAAAALGFLVLGAQTGLFVAHGVVAPGAGSLAQRADRHGVFKAEPGIRVIVSDNEKRQLETIDQLIRSHSQPNERIVCVPYCPGYAFMAGRRLLFGEHYVDDSTPALFPGWLPRAIARTAEARPPVILVQDWAPNGTDSSRFSVWAAAYLDYVRANYPVSVPIAGVGTVWLLQPTDPGKARTATVAAYGPTGTRAGQPFNRQPDGSSALWLRVPGLRPTAILRFDDRPLASAVSADGISAVVPPELFAVPGRHWLEVTDEAFNVHTTPVPFDVSAP